ncbi:MAG: lamin tail domain-containing protein [Pyrinomonadaceae bacterium]
MKSYTKWALMLSVSVLVSLLAFGLTSSAADPQQQRKGAEKTQQERPDAKANGAGRVQPGAKRNTKTRTPSLTDNPGEAKEVDPDLPAFMKGRINEMEYHRLRNENIQMLLGMTPGEIYNPVIRSRAVQQMQQQERQLKIDAARSAGASGKGDRPILPLISSSVWDEIGPQPIPNGQTSIIPTPVNGRTPTLAIHPTNPDIIYAGPAQGGVYRTLNGGQTWTQIFNDAETQVVGVLTLAPSNPEILYVGTGEAGLCGSGCFAGIGIYRIDNASTTATLTGPINPTSTYTIGLETVTLGAFTGRTISEILVSPTDPGTIFVATATGIVGNPNAGPNGNFIPPNALLGLYRSTNAAAADPATITFQKLTVTTGGSLDTPGTGNRRIMDLAFDPGDTTANTLVAWVFGTASAAGPPATIGDGGIYRTTNALAANPTFTQTLVNNIGNVRGEFAVNRVAGVTTMYAATGEVSDQTCTGAANTAAQGALRRSIDGGVTWSATINSAGGYCGGQCFYDIAIDIDPTDANTIYLGGSAPGTCSRVLARSTNGGATFSRSDPGLHADTHAIMVSPSNPNIVLTGDDGGIFRSVNRGLAWTSLNNTGYSAVQFQGLGIHPTDRYMTLGGTQDNGTQLMLPSNESLRPINQFRRADFGDGGYALIDQSASDTTNVTMYHTYFNQRLALIGFARTSRIDCAIEGEWAFKGFGVTAGTPNDCGDVTGPNGIAGTDNVLFYAPMALGPGTPNTLYFGTDRLYRSMDRGDTMVLASQVLNPNPTPTPGATPGPTPIVTGTTISTIGISPQNDAVRIVGLTNGLVFATTAGLPVLTNVTPPGSPGTGTSRRLVGRVQIDPLDVNTAYVAYGGQNLATGQTHLYKTTDLNAATPTWAAVGAGIPDVPVNALQIDPVDSTRVYAGTDVGVFVSTDGGANFVPFGTGLPRIAVFQMEIQNANRFLRIATHGRGLWEISLLPPNSISISGAITFNGAPAEGVTVKLTGTTAVTQVTGPTGLYNFPSLSPGENYTVTPASNVLTFTPPSRTYNDLTVSQAEQNFTGVATVSSSPPAVSQVLISEFRPRGSGGAGDEFIELYNNTDADITVQDGSGGWAMDAARTDGSRYTLFTIPNGTVIPARGHYLAAAGSYSLSGNTVPDFFYPEAGVDLLNDNTGLALYATNDRGAFGPENRLDAVGFANAPVPDFEGTKLADIGTTNGEISLVRTLVSGTPQDTNNNLNDFLFISTTGGNFGGTVNSILGSPGPQNSRSPKQRNAQISASLIEPTMSSASSPNRERDGSSAASGVNRQFGTLTIRRRFTNNTGQSITKLRFRAVDMTTFNSPNIGVTSQADVRMLDAIGSFIVTSLSPAGPTPLCIRPMRLEMPPTLNQGGGYNSTVTLDLTQSITGTFTTCQQNGLAPGQSVDVEFLLGVQANGIFRYLLNIETLP